MSEMIYLLATLCVLLVCAVGALAFALHQANKSLDEIAEESMLCSRDAALEKRILCKTYAHVRESLNDHYDKCHSNTGVL